MVQTFVKRPISPLNFEPLLVSPKDVLWPGSDDEANDDETRRKRKRIEDLGTQYLEGRPLFIQTAGLRGPLNNGWVNPWAGKRRKTGAYHSTTDAATRTAKAGLAGKISTESLPSSGKRVSTTNIGYASVTDIDAGTRLLEDPRARRRRAEEVAFPKREAAQVHPEKYPDAGAYPTGSKAALAGESEAHRGPWLKTDRDYLQSRANDDGPSCTPTPSVRPRDKLREDRGQQRLSSAEIMELRKNQKIASKEKAGLGPHSDAHDVSQSSQHFQSPIPIPSQNTGNPTPSRLAPYVSEFDLKDDAATSAGLRAIKKAPTPKPSPHAAPPSTNLPAFEYRYASKGSSTHAVKLTRNSAHALQETFLRRRSESTSSSGSSDFVKEFEAAQAQASAKSIGSSFSSSSVKERQETASVGKNTQAMRRLTFTASGEPRIADSRRHLRQDSKPLVDVRSDASPKRVKSKSTKSGEKVAVESGSKKSSDIPLTNGNVSHTSVVLPEAQVISDAPFQLAQLPSGPSTNLLETDKQSPKFISLDDEDSFLNLSTQAAMQKAQRSFKDDMVSPVKLEVSPSKEKSPGMARNGSTTTTPTVNGRSTRVAHGKFVKPEPISDEEPMSTQAMADAISPFAVTTVKKGSHSSKNADDFARSPISPEDPSPIPSPTGSFHKPLSMSTTPPSSHAYPSSQPKSRQPIPYSQSKITSKPTSTLTSFSVLPDGTVTETSSIFQDGQQSQRQANTSLPLDPLGTPFATAHEDEDQSNGSLDLNAAIEEAGSFLGDWNVETEAKKEASARTMRERGKG